MPNAFSFNQFFGPSFVFGDMWKSIIQGDWVVEPLTSILHNLFIWNTSGAQNDEIEYELLAQEGPKIFEILYHKNDSSGKIHVYIDGVEIGTIDEYAPGLFVNFYGQLNFTAAFTGTHSVRIKAATKNPSSTGYTLAFTWLRIK